MVENIKLYINDKLVDLSADPRVLYTYQHTDVTNPTVIKNSFSKTITIMGTPNNNDIFGHYWNLERYLLNGGQGGAYYNSSKKAPFKMFIGDELYEEGYAKLTSITKVDDSYKYEVSLFGGLGDFFWNLSTSNDGDKKKLSDLTFRTGQSEFDFTANIGTVRKAWNTLSGDGPRSEWDDKFFYINFIPAYNGIPSDFDANKVIVNTSGTTLTKSVQNSQDGKTYTTKNGFTVGTLPSDMSEWEVRDLRSYMQRPCIRMKAIIDACCKPENNGGYTVDLDEDFFNEGNPYWEKTWLTLPMVQNLEYSNEQQVLEGVSLRTRETTGETSGLMYQDLYFELGEIEPNVSSIDVSTTIKISASTAVHNTSYVWFWNWNGDDYHTGYWCLGSLFCQLIAVNGDTVVGASDVYNLTTPIRHNGNLYYGHNGHYPESSEIDPQTGRIKMGSGSQYVPYLNKSIYSILGNFDSNGNFVEEVSYTDSGSTFSDTPHTFTFRIRNINTNITGLKMVYYWGATADKVKQSRASNTLFENTYSDAWIFYHISYLPTTLEGHTMVEDSIQHNLSAVMGESLGRTGTKVNKQLLLNTESSPCDYLLSYCKMFGLHFTKDIGAKNIHIMTRKTFYQRDNIVDLEDLIDRSKDINITPITFTSKWYEFIQDKDETALQKKYTTTNGVEYGSKILDTGYDFIAEKVDLLKDNCIKSGIECLEKSKWFSAYNNDSSLRPWMNLGLKYTLWNGTDSIEYNAGIGNSGTLLPINEGEGMKYYDVIPKLQFHDDKNAPTDGNNCLVFLSGFKSVNSGRSNPLTYILSDDSVYQTDLNDGTPCWLFTKQEVVDGRRLCYKLNKIPVFERYLTSSNSGNVLKSLDFGTAQELYVPSYNITDTTNIYNYFWRSYLTDMFDVNTKQMTCYVKINGKPGIDWLRRFYWFDNSIWVVNKISDYNITSNDTTKIEFIKVQDINNYTSISQGAQKTIELSANTYNVPSTGGTVIMTVTAEPDVEWRITRSLTRSSGSTIDVTYSPTAGTGTMNVTAVFGPNPDELPRGTNFYAVRRDNGQSAGIYIKQGYGNEQSVRAEPEDLVIPASGGSYVIDFIWYNQGDSYIYFVDYNEGDEYLQFTADTSTLRNENKAILTFGENTGDTVLHNYCTFRDYDQNVYVSIGLDQLPGGYSFPGSGGTNVMTVEYASNAVFSDVPYWLTITNNGNDTYTLTANENLYYTDETATVTMSNGSTSAKFNVTIGSGGTNLVTPNTLVFDSTGGTQTLSVAIQNVWRIVAKPSWLTTSVDSGATPNHVSVTTPPYSGTDEREGTIVFYDTVSTKTYQVTVIQNPSQGEMLAVSPSRLTFPASGGTILLTIISNTDWTIA